MNISIIGAGNVGGALAQNFSTKGHKITLGVKAPEKETGWKENKNINVTTVFEAANDSDIIIVALPVTAIVPVAKSMGNLKGKVIIDATNSVFGKPDPYKTGYHAFKELTHADLAKGFNTTGYENMINPKFGNIVLDMFTAGDSEKAKSVMKELSKEAGFENCYDFGGADKVELLEQFALAWINLAIMQKEGRDIAFKVLKR